MTGLLNGSVVATDSYTLANTDVYAPTFPNWTTEFAASLAGKPIDDLHIALNAGFGLGGATAQNVDNIVLNPVNPVTAVPEPDSLVLLGTGLLGLGAILRRRRKSR